MEPDLLKGVRIIERRSLKSKKMDYQKAFQDRKICMRIVICSRLKESPRKVA
jgi:hypothetical protein